MCVVRVELVCSVCGAHTRRTAHNQAQHTQSHCSKTPYLQHLVEVLFDAGPPVGHLVAVAGDLKALAALLEAHDGDVGQALLACCFVFRLVCVDERRLRRWRVRVWRGAPWRERRRLRLKCRTSELACVLAQLPLKRTDGLLDVARHGRTSAPPLLRAQRWRARAPRVGARPTARDRSDCLSSASAQASA